MRQRDRGREHRRASKETITIQQGGSSDEAAPCNAGRVCGTVVDDERIELDVDSVDGVLCRIGYMLMPDPAAAFAETRRVLRPGGRVALAVWGAPDRNPFFMTIAMSLVQRGHMPAPVAG